MSSPEAKSEPVNVRILDRDYTVGVSDDERASLISAARLLDERMREVRGNNRRVATERIAVLAALNLAHELQQVRDVLTVTGSLASRNSQGGTSPARVEEQREAAKIVVGQARSWSAQRVVGA